MKRVLLIIAFILLIPFSSQGVDSTSKITELPDLPSPVGADLLVVVDDVAGTATTKKATLSNIVSGMNINTSSDVIPDNTLICGDGGARGIKECTAVIFTGVKKNLAISNSNLGKGATAPAQVILGNYNGWEYDINDDSVFTFHIPHDYKAETDVEIQIDWYIDEAYATNNGEVNWQIEYSSTPHDSTEAIDSPTHSGTLSTGDINIPATAKFFTSNTITITSANLELEDQVGINLTRIALVGGVNPTAKPTIIDIHIEYIADKFGESL